MRRLVPVLLLLCAPLSAQITEKEARSQLKAATADGLAGLKTQLATLKVDLDAALDAWDEQVKDETDPLDILDELFDAAMDFQKAMIDTLEDAGFAVDVDECNILAAYQDTGDLEGHYPEGFHPNDGSTVEKYRASLAKAVAKAYATAEKRLRKSAALAEKEAEVALLVYVAPPFLVRDTAVGAGFLVNPESFPATIDVVVSASSLAADADGLLCMGGSADPDRGDITLFIHEAEADDPIEETVTPDPIDKRWGTISDNLGAFWIEGNYSIQAEQCATGFAQTASVGLR